MKLMKKYLFMSVAVMLGALTMTSCSDDDDNNSTESVSAGKILFSTTVTNPDGSTGSGYLQAVSELEGGMLITDGFAELGRYTARMIREALGGIQTL